MNSRFHPGLVLLLTMAFVASRAQDAPGFRIGGIVHDGTGSLITSARVTARQIETNMSQTAQTDDQGTFRINVSAVGSYVIAIDADGFAPYENDVALTQDATCASLDVTLKVTANAETVEVTADALAAETTSTQLGETLGSRKIESVPLNGRNFTDLMAVQPGIVPVNTSPPGAVIMTGVATTPPSGNANPGNLSISGQREDSNGFRVNGADVEEDVNMGTSIVPNLDAIDSFRVLTSNFDAEYGNSSGGQILVVTKSGGDQVHGGVFEFLRN
ncbi:MAG: carboxypeptidase-like regulatory domain-containing protein, partial [Terracidiphilus sp.]